MNAANDKRKNKNADKNGSRNRDHFSFDDKRIEKVDEFMLVHDKFILEVFCCADLILCTGDRCDDLATFLRHHFCTKIYYRGDSDSTVKISFIISEKFWGQN